MTPPADAHRPDTSWLGEPGTADETSGTVSIQPHGVLLAANAGSLTITHASANSSELLGFEAQALIGRHLGSVLGVEWTDDNTGVLGGVDDKRRPIEVSIGDRRFDVIVHHTGETVVLELEPSSVTPGHDEVLAVYRAIGQLTRASTDRELWEAAAVALQQLTDFDRVMVNRLHPDGHGEIVAEEAADGMDRYLGLNFPASDFPEQMRDAYRANRARLIVSSSAESSIIVGDPGTGKPSLDLAGAELRSVSAYDLFFMRTLGHASVLSLSLVRGGELIGVITLASRTAVVVPYAIRQGLVALANQVALHLDSMAQISRLTESVRLRTIRMQLTDQLVLRRSTDASAIAGALFDGELSVLDLIPADGAMICLGTHTTTVGETPRASAVRAAMLPLGTALAGRSITTAALAEDFPEAAALLPGVSGLIVTPLPGFDGFIAWFRMAKSEQRDWFGSDPDATAAASGPQRSFPSWSQTITDRSVSWAGLETEADDLARDLTLAMLRQADTQLAALALRDALTGLPNRRLLMDRIELSLAKKARTAPMTVLFVDLDGFKAVNDTHGHDAGDTLLVHIANRILETTRSPDTVARLGGDEFVVLCDDITEQEAAAVASRIADAIRQPIDIGGAFVTVTASVGMAVAESSATAVELLKRADSAMYRAKVQGRDRVSV